MKWSKKSKWIWLNREEKKDTYGDFFTTFNYESGEVMVQISADSNYVMYVNGRFVDSGQYADFPHYKVYDRLDITKYCCKGENKLAIIVWYYGIKGTLTYFKGNAALRFEVCNNESLCAYSDKNVLSRISKSYENCLEELITPQIGYGFHYNATREDNWKMGDVSDFQESREVEQELPLYERPVKKLIVGKQIEASLVKEDTNYWLYDMGREEVGYLTVRVKSDRKQKLSIRWGEHIVDGSTRWNNNGRNFSVSLTIGEGITDYTNYFRRLGLRYLEICSENNLEIEYATVLPCYYPINKVERKFSNPLHQRIYDVGVRTLELCMHEHYEDCPWREQALYAMDSRNQMLCGYYAFNEYQFPRASLSLIGQDRREDGLLSICAPCDWDSVIPSYSLHYYIEVWEYLKYSADKTLAIELFPKLQSVMEVFLNNMKDGLICSFTGLTYWNFYEWTEDLSDSDPDRLNDKVTLDAALNCLLSIALDCMQKICATAGIDAQHDEMRRQLNECIRSTFYKESKGLYVNRYGEEKYSELVNALAIVCGAATDEEAEKICEILTSEKELTQISLSMVCFKYDALLKCNKEKYSSYILQDIEKKYSAMLDAGATSFWETEKGEADFWGAGSLCHGWSAMPVYYLSILQSV